MVLLYYIRKFTDYFFLLFFKVAMQIKHEIYLAFIIIVNLFLYNCAGSSSEVIDPGKTNQTQIENNKVKVSVEQQKNKIIELESLIIN